METRPHAQDSGQSPTVNAYFCALTLRCQNTSGSLTPAATRLQGTNFRVVDPAYPWEGCFSLRASDADLPVQRAKALLNEVGPS
jgi:hypothetical protein